MKAAALARRATAAAALLATAAALAAPYEIEFEATVRSSAGWPAAPAAGAKLSGSIVLDDDEATHQPEPAPSSPGYRALRIAAPAVRWQLEAGVLAFTSATVAAEVFDNDLSLLGQQRRGDLVSISTRHGPARASLQLRGGEASFVGTRLPPPAVLARLAEGATLEVQGAGGTALRFSAAVTLLRLHQPARAAAAATPDAGAACMQDTPRQTYQHPAGLDQATLPELLPQHRRRELQALIWPSDRSLRGNVRDWLLRDDFACLEAVFTDLEATQARFADGQSKVASFLGGARDFVDASSGLTAQEIEAKMGAWRAATGRTLLSEVMEVRLFLAAAWHARGDGVAAEVTRAGWQAFARLGDEARARAARLSEAARNHLLGHHVVLRAAMYSDAPLPAKQRLAVEAVRRYPQELSLGAYAAERSLPRWGGSLRAFEAHVQQLRGATGPGHADRLYAYLHLQVLGLEALQPPVPADRAAFTRGLLSLADAGSPAHIAALQALGCRWRDEALLRGAQRRWAAYAAQPQLEPPADTLEATCRAWVQTLPKA